MTYYSDLDFMRVMSNNIIYYSDDDFKNNLKTKSDFKKYREILRVDLLALICGMIKYELDCHSSQLFFDMVKSYNKLIDSVNTIGKINDILLLKESFTELDNVAKLKEIEDYENMLRCCYLRIMDKSYRKIKNINSEILRRFILNYKNLINYKRP